jgi:hypothetical protein
MRTRSNSLFSKFNIGTDQVRRFPIMVFVGSTLLKLDFFDVEVFESHH